MDAFSEKQKVHLRSYGNIKLCTIALKQVSITKPRFKKILPHPPDEVLSRSRHRQVASWLLPVAGAAGDRLGDDRTTGITIR